jgi:hypothetical protein
VLATPTVAAPVAGCGQCVRRAAATAGKSNDCERQRAEEEK